VGPAADKEATLHLLRLPLRLQDQAQQDKEILEVIRLESQVVEVAVAPLRLEEQDQAVTAEPDIPG
jgi:hypothetical protein